VTAVTLTNVAATGAQALIATQVMGPTEYGLFLIAMIVLNLARQIVEFTVNPAVIFRQSRGEREQDTAFSIALILSVVVFALVQGACVVLIAVGQEARPLQVLMVASLVVPVVGLSTIHAAILERDIRFDRLCPGEVLGMVAGFAAMIPMAVSGLGAFALAWGMVVAAVVKTLWLWVRGPEGWRPRLLIDHATAPIYLRFGAYRLWTNLVNFGVNRYDQAVVGTVFGAEALGLYGLSWTIIVEPIMRINGIANRLFLPTLARIRRHRRPAGRIYLSMLRILTTFTAPLILGGAAVSLVFFEAFMPARWQEAGPLVQILAVASLARSVVNPVGSIPIAFGRADFAFWWTAIVLAVQSTALTLVAFLGDFRDFTVAVACCSIAVLVASWPVVIRPFLPVRFLDYAQAPSGAVLKALAMAAVVQGVVAVAPGPPWSVFAIAVAAGVLSYLLLMGLFDRQRLTLALSALSRKGRRHPIGRSRA